MNDENDPLASDGDWVCLTVSGNPRAMEQHGPNLKVSISGIAGDGSKLASHDVPAIVDTGAQACCISPRLAAEMKGGVEGVRHISHIYGRVEDEKTIRGALVLPNGIEFVRDFSVLLHLDDYDVIIGRDVLSEGRLFMDLGKGEFRLYFPAS